VASPAMARRAARSGARSCTASSGRASRRAASQPRAHSSLHSSGTRGEAISQAISQAISACVAASCPQLSAAERAQPPRLNNAPSGVPPIIAVDGLPVCQTWRATGRAGHLVDWPAAGQSPAVKVSPAPSPRTQRFPIHAATQTSYDSHPRERSNRSAAEGRGTRWVRRRPGRILETPATPPRPSSRNSSSARRRWQRWRRGEYYI
jgi:hypothetical protein